MAKKNVEGLLIPAGCLIGLGLGLALDEIAAGVLIGLGVGFFATFITLKMKKK